MKTLPYMQVFAAYVLIASTLSATSITPAQEKRAVSPLQNLLNVFASQDAASWASFDTVPGVRWRDARPLANPDAIGIDESLYRSGNLLLSGFGEVYVPDGSVGAGAGIRKDNEGDVGVTLNGNVNKVQSIALLKFYPSENYAHIIQRQLGVGATVKPIAGQCPLGYGTTAANTQKNAFYQVAFGAAVPIYAEAYADEDGGNQGPGSPDQHSDSLAAALVVVARRDGSSQIHHVALSDDASRTFAMQGEPGSPLRRTTQVQTTLVTNTSIEQSSLVWRQIAVPKQAEQVQAQPLPPSHREPQLQHPAQSMGR